MDRPLLLGDTSRTQEEDAELAQMEAELANRRALIAAQQKERADKARAHAEKLEQDRRDAIPYTVHYNVSGDIMPLVFDESSRRLVAQACPDCKWASINDRAISEVFHFHAPGCSAMTEQGDATIDSCGHAHTVSIMGAIPSELHALVGPVTVSTHYTAGRGGPNEIADPWVGWGEDLPGIMYSYTHRTNGTLSSASGSGSGGDGSDESSSEGDSRERGGVLSTRSQQYDATAGRLDRRTERTATAEHQNIPSARSTAREESSSGMMGGESAFRRLVRVAIGRHTDAPAGISVRVVRSHDIQSDRKETIVCITSTRLGNLLQQLATLNGPTVPVTPTQYAAYHESKTREERNLLDHIAGWISQQLPPAAGLVILPPAKISGSVGVEHTFVAMPDRVLLSGGVQVWDTNRVLPQEHPVSSGNGGSQSEIILAGDGARGLIDPHRRYISTGAYPRTSLVSNPARRSIPFPVLSDAEDPSARSAMLALLPGKLSSWVYVPTNLLRAAANGSMGTVQRRGGGRVGNGCCAACQRVRCTDPIYHGIIVTGTATDI